MDLNILVAVPSYGFMKTRFVSSLFSLYGTFMKQKVAGYDNQNMWFGFHEGSGISQGREDLVEAALRTDYITHVLFIDEDMGFLPDAFYLMASRKKDIVGTAYRIKVPPCPFTAVDFDSKPIDITEESTGLQEVRWMGFGFALIDKKVFQAMEAPRFSIFWNPQVKKYTTEDGPFFMKAKELGFPVYVDLDASKLVYHNGNWAFSWDDKFTPEQRHPYAERLRNKVNI